MTLRSTRGRATQRSSSKNKMSLKTSHRFAVISTATVVVVLILCALGVLFVPSVNKTVSGALSILKTDSAQSATLFINLKAQRSPLAVLPMALCVVLVPTLPLGGLLTAAQNMFGAAWGTALVWLGLMAGMLSATGLVYLLIGQHVLRWRRKKHLSSEPTKASILIGFGLRLIPAVPQGLVAYGFGATASSLSHILAGSALASTMLILVTAGNSPLLWWIMTLAGCALLAGTLYLKRDTFSSTVLTPERKRMLVIVSGLVIILGAIYFAVPSVKDWVDAGINVTLGNPAGVATYLRGFGLIGPIVSFFLMVLQSVAAPLPAFVITFANGMIWGWLWGALLSWTSAMAGAALCFWLARLFGRPLVEKLAGGSSALEISDKFFDKFGNKAVLIARLLPFVSFDIISYGAGLTSMGFGEFFLATGLGQLPATLVYSYLASVGGAATSIKILLYVFVATAVLLVLGISLKPWFMKKFFNQNTEKPHE